MKKFFLVIFFSIGFNQLSATINQQLLQTAKQTCSYIKPILENSYQYFKAVDQKCVVALGALLFGFALLYFKKKNSTTKIYKPIPKKFQKDAQELALNLWTENIYYYSGKETATAESGSVWQNGLIKPILESGHKTAMQGNPGLEGVELTNY